MGIPKSQVDQLKNQIARLETENARINAEFIKTRSKLQGSESEHERVSSKLSFELQ
jgi:regulator of replication initiation timing